MFGLVFVINCNCILVRILFCGILCAASTGNVFWSGFRNKSYLYFS